MISGANTTYHATRGLNSFGLAVKLIAKAFDVIQAISNDNGVSSQDAFNRRIFSRPGIFFRSSFSVYISTEAEGLIIYEDNRQTANMRLGGSFDLGLEVFYQLI